MQVYLEFSNKYKNCSRVENKFKPKVRKNSLNIVQIVQSSLQTCDHVITSVRTQPLSSFVLQPERGYKCQSLLILAGKNSKKLFENFVHSESRDAKNFQY